ncbi:MAG: hypothetical protein HZC40_15890 [Chloroflexi bacterium]|nr:hypothetical protein [Chloroflexota bacterium]
MNPRFEAAWEIHKFLTKHKITYAIIGGTALPRWGEPRFTKDVDLTVLPSLEEGVAPFVRLLLTRFTSRDPDALAFARQNRVVKIKASNQCDVDVSLLIILKSVAGRPQDLIDIAGVIIRQRNNLDTAYIRKWLKFFDEYLPEPHAVDDFERAWRAEKRTMREARPVYQTKRKTR